MGIVTRILLIAAIALLAFFWIRKMLRSGDGSEKKPSEPSPPEQWGSGRKTLLPAITVAFICHVRMRVS